MRRAVEFINQVKVSYILSLNTLQDQASLDVYESFIQTLKLHETGSITMDEMNSQIKQILTPYA